MAESAAAHEEHGEKEPDNVQGGEVAARITGTQVSAKPPCEVEAVEELPEQLEAGVGGESIARKAKGQIRLDWSRQITFSMSHRWCPFVSGRSW